MIETILQWDTTLMHDINAGWSHPLLDFLFPLFRNKFFWLPLYVLCLAWIIYNHRIRHIVLIFLCLFLAIFASDTISAKLIKYQVARPRPCQEVNMHPPVIVRVNCGSGFSFPSAHAANHFCLASFLISIFGYFFGRWKYMWWLWAILISLAQVYVGVHYPLDILGGAILGIIVGTSMGRFCYYRLQPITIQPHPDN